MLIYELIYIFKMNVKFTRKRGLVMYGIIATLFVTMLLSVILTPFVRLMAFKCGAVDNPNARRVNQVVMPTMVD